jgi:hypothetical protein
MNSSDSSVNENKKMPLDSDEIGSEDDLDEEMEELEDSEEE